MSIELLDSDGVMELLMIKSETTLLKYERMGKIKHYRPFGKKKYYKKSEIINLFS